MEQLLPQLPEVLPEAQRTALQLLPRRAALRAVHQPKDLAEAAAARRRLIFEELFFMQLGLLRLRQSVREKSAPALCGGTGLDFFASLPFAPTKAQLRAAEEGLRDLAKPVPMRRLLQGDVGSGKTAVAAALLEQAAQSGWQAALMAPTELLARQHCETLAKLFARRSLAPVLLTGSIPAAQKRKIKAGLRTGSIPLVVGTHALLQKDVAFARLGLAVVDEQHRFGVEQRSLLEEAGAGQPSPHVLVMSATPIPRSLALFVFGDLDISVLDELPPGRTPVETYAVTSALRARAYRYVAKHLEQGRQGYVVCPRVEDEGESELTAATQFAAQLQADWLRGYSVGLLHGRCKPKQKEEVMRAFAAGEIQLLVSTTVIEVGVDVPNAVIMVIENAERFGLSQLHQLRGRVGRGGGRATCILISDAENEEARRRLELMKETNDGFVIAREDLRLRGPGDFFGRRQHGLPQFKLADLLEDSALLPAAKEAALAVFQEDPSLAAPEHRQLRAEVERMMEA
jgi:ATP-dependent DNA helicase RecG